MLSSKDYHAHISQVHRTPSVLPDVPHYPNVHLAFGKKAVYEEDKVREKVEVTESDQTESGEVASKETVDVETDQHDLRRYKGCFELQNWKTFRYP